MTAIFWIIIGGSIGFVVSALCASAGKSDKISEKMGAKFIPNMMMETSEDITPEKQKK